jgi:A/G-specific adenine glycosylase
MDERTRAEFREAVWDFYHDHGRHDLPWRLPEADGSFDPYKILVSEIMLQQTQVPRVILKYEAFLAKFPDVKSLAVANLGEVLSAWNGLGYNRRAKFLLSAAQKTMRDFGGTFPADAAELQQLPGVGANTAGAVAVYAFNQPAAFIETNIRTVFIHHFFGEQKRNPRHQTRHSRRGGNLVDNLSLRAAYTSTGSPVKPGMTVQKETGVSDSVILELVGETLDREQPRIWFWSLMDYGSFLKQTVGNLNRASKSYAKQSKFAGSRRQLRGAIIRMLLERSCTAAELAAALPDERLDAVLAELTREGFLRQTGKRFSIAR